MLLNKVFAIDLELNKKVTQQCIGDKEMNIDLGQEAKFVSVN